MSTTISGPAVIENSFGWVVINTHAHRERVAIENLERQGFRSYCPLIVKRVRHARRYTDELRPLFPGYVFAEVHRDARQWRPLLSTVGVRQIVRTGSELSILDHRFIESLKARELNGAIARPESPYAVGQTVLMRGGPFDGVVARIIALGERDRLTVLMKLMNGGEVPVQTVEDRVHAP